MPASDQDRRPKVMIFGTFDCLHAGHRFVIRTAMRRGRVTIVVARDTTVHTIKNIHPSQSETIRCHALLTEFPEVTVVLGSPHDFMEPIRTHAPDIILLGYDQTLPPGIAMEHISCVIERLPSYHPEHYKSSVMRRET